VFWFLVAAGIIAIAYMLISNYLANRAEKRRIPAIVSPCGMLIGWLADMDERPDSERIEACQQIAAKASNVANYLKAKEARE
jgi:hypothetical protein